MPPLLIDFSFFLNQAGCIMIQLNCAMCLTEWASENDSDQMQNSLVMNEWMKGIILLGQMETTASVFPEEFQRAFFQRLCLWFTSSQQSLAPLLNNSTSMRAALSVNQANQAAIQQITDHEHMGPSLDVVVTHLLYGNNYIWLKRQGDVTHNLSTTRRIWFCDTW